MMNSTRKKMNSRQQPGLACEACRGKKLRCDREQPQCGTCKAASIPCVVDLDRLPRGRKGNVRTLQTKIVDLTRRLADMEKQRGEESTAQSSAQSRNHIAGAVCEKNQIQAVPISGSQDPPAQIEGFTFKDLEVLEALSSAALSHDAISGDLMEDEDPGPYAYHTAVRHDSVISPPLFDALSPPAFNYPCTEPILTTFNAQGNPGSNVDVTSLTWTPLNLSHLVCADLDHLYFDRVHPFVPFLNRTQYFRQCRQAVEDVPQSTRALRHAMWTLAASFSTQFQHIQKSLYAQTKLILDELDLIASVEPITIKELQARALLVLYEMMCMDCRTAWMSVGCCMRHALLRRLHEIDVSNSPPDANDDNLARMTDPSWTGTEEQRRLFWVIYALDCFINLVNDAPLRMDEETILTRLPSPEANFENAQPITTAFISETLSGQKQCPKSGFVEIIVILAISGHCLLHRRCSMAETVNHASANAFWGRHRAIEVILSKTKAHVTAKPYADVVQADPLSLLCSMMSAALILMMHKIMDSVNLDRMQHQTAIAEYDQKASDAATGLITLSSMIASLSYFKVHPFTPFPLMICVEFLLSQKGANEQASVQAAEVWGELHLLCSVNNLASILLAKLQRGS